MVREEWLDMVVMVIFVQRRVRLLLLSKLVPVTGTVLIANSFIAACLFCARLGRGVVEPKISM